MAWPYREAMSLLVIPNVSEGQDRRLIDAMRSAVDKHARVLDVHIDAVHGRTVLTVSGAAERLPRAMTELAAVALNIDLTRQQGVHPRLGVLDVCPYVCPGPSSDVAVRAARATGRLLAEELSLPVYLYGRAAYRETTRELPALRRGRLQGLIRRLDDLPPDLGPASIDPRRGVVCVGARGVLIAFNVFVRADLSLVREIAVRVRSPQEGIRALGFAGRDPDVGQVSMNLVDPDRLGIDDALDRVEGVATYLGAEVVATEIVGLPPERFMPDPDAKAARLLISPGRSLESALRS